MYRLDRAVRDRIKVLEREIVERALVAIQEGMLWKGKKLVSVEKWEKMKNKEQVQHEMLHYIPDGYVSNPFSYSKDEELWNKRNEWYKLYLEFLEERKFPKYGASKCGGCILQPGIYKEYNFDFNLKEIMLTGIRDKKCEIKFPCGVLNIFECPYGQDKNANNALFTLRDMYEIITSALTHAKTLTMLGNNHTFEVDFESNWFEGYSDIRFRPNTWGTVEKNLSGLSLSKIPIRTIQDIYNVLTNRESLDTILEQYLKHTSNYESCTENDSKHLKEMKKSIIDYFVSIKNQIKIQDIMIGNGLNFEEEKQYFKDQERLSEWFEKNDKEYYPFRKGSGKCVLCRKFANIHCTNCDVWVCVNHWREHGLDTHNFKTAAKEDPKVISRYF